MTAIGISENEYLQPTSWPWAQGRSAHDCWDDWAVEVAAWCVRHDLDARDVVVLLPVGALLPVARQAWARAVGGWLPRIETVPTLADALVWSSPGPERKDTDAAVSMGAGPAPTLDVVLDRLLVTQALTAQDWGRQWAQRDRQAFDHAVAQVVDSAHLWVRVAQSRPPDTRPLYWDCCRDALGISNPGGATGPGGRERLLLAWALGWASSSDDGRWPTDALFIHQAAAWVGVTAGEAVVPGSESSVMLAVLQHAARCGAPVLWMTAEAGRVLATQVVGTAPALAVCLDFEEEAQRATAQVLAAVSRARERGADPVALIAIDRSLVRRIRALLEGAGATVSDETGWKLSTTRAGAAVTRLLQASRPDASTDDLLDWLKSGWVQWPEYGSPSELDSAIAVLETWCRRHGLLAAWTLVRPDVEVATLQLPMQSESASELLPGGRQAMPESARQLWVLARQTVQVLSPLWASRRLPLSTLLGHVAEALQRCGAWSVLMQDDAGSATLEALRLQASSPGDAPAWSALSGILSMDGRGLSRWVAQVLEESSFKMDSAASGDARVDVVVTPMTRAVLRPFSAVVMPGADEGQLGAMNGVPGWVHGPLCEQMGLPTKTTLRDAQWASFVLLMAQPQIACLCRKADGREPLEPSPWFERWSLHTGLRLTSLVDDRPELTLLATPVKPPQPRLLNGDEGCAGPEGLRLPLPEQITATSYEALRQCPYRFYAQYVLGLRALDELDEGLDRSDFGIWLHGVLQQFHAQRVQGPTQPAKSEDLALWQMSTDLVTTQLGFDRDNRRPYFMPYAATLDALGAHYVDWLHEHERATESGDAGWRFAQAERTVQWPLEVSDGITVRLHGQIDRLDRRGQGADAAWCVIDYKTGSKDGLKQIVKQALEDTQLAFYAALAQHAPASIDSLDPTPLIFNLEAMYLHLDEKGVTAVEHPEVLRSAEAVIDGVRHDLLRIVNGAALPALGEGKACEYCDVRGLCRRDHWTVTETQP
ncbi:MAG: PD-(D/E)XK nuclease family protein [Burkholderiales bacterium]|nr:PD-(D/E)XK nuclease family protein [Burkholderiales bacterium]